MSMARAEAQKDLEEAERMEDGSSSRVFAALLGILLLAVGFNALVLNPEAPSGRSAGQPQVSVVSLQKLALGIAASVSGSIFLAASLVAVRVDSLILRGIKARMDRRLSSRR